MLFAGEYPIPQKGLMGVLDENLSVLLTQVLKRAICSPLRPILKEDLVTIHSGYVRLK